MTGYWCSVIESGHKTGPPEDIYEYEKTYDDPFGLNRYK